MRQIKFRAWIEAVLPEETGLYYPTVIQLMADGSVDKFWTNDYKFTADTSKFTLMEWTGLKDKNSTEIYEGDIVQEGKHHRYKIRWSQSMAGFKKRHIVKYGKEPDELMNKSDTLEVIGNIYENPELLK